MAHALYNHDGPCRNIHGHTYRLEVTLGGEPITDPGHPKDGMLLDFKEFKELVKIEVLDEFDHTLVLNEVHREKLTGITDSFKRTVFVDFQPTCENLLLEIKEKLGKKLPAGCDLHSLRLHETPTSFAEWNKNDN